MERRFRITVDGRPYDVTVDDLSEGGSLLYPQPGSMTVPRPGDRCGAAQPRRRAAAARLPPAPATCWLDHGRRGRLGVAWRPARRSVRATRS